MISTTHKLPKPDKTQCIIDKSGVGVVGQTRSKKSDFASHIFDWGCTILGGVCQLDFLEELSKEGMRNLNNQSAQLVGTSWD